jgi:exosortase
MGTISALMFVYSGILLFSYGIWPGQNDYFKDLGMVETLFGIVTFLCGWEVMKTAWFPILFLICALPWPGLFYSMLAGPLQKFAAMVAVRLLNLLGVSSGQFGTKIFIVAKDQSIHTLNVAEACAGLRSLMTFVSIAAAVAFLSFRPLWQKITMVFSAIPIAISCNTLRVTVQGLLTRYSSGQWGEEFAHGFVGFVMMIPAFFLILLVGWVLQNIFIDEVSDKKSLGSNYTSARGGTKRTVASVQKVAAIPRDVPRPGGNASRPAAPRKTAAIPPSNSSTPARPARQTPRSKPEGTA